MIDLSADLGEGSPDEEHLWPLITSANVACGGHAGDAATMAAAAGLAKIHGVRLGAHPSYPDRANFGRRSMDLPPDDLRASLVAQISALRAFAPVRHVKPHGALYNDAHRRRDLADVIVQAIRLIDPSIALVASASSAMAAAAADADTPFIREAFADRRYEPDGSLTPRSVPGATLEVDEAAAQAELLVREQTVIARNGARVQVAFDTLCVHADMERAAERLRAIRERLSRI